MIHRGLDRSRPPAEMVTEAITQANESLTNPRQSPHLGVGSRVFLTPSEAVPLIVHLSVPCLLIKRALSLLIYQNQSDKSDKVEIVTILIINSTLSDYRQVFDLLRFYQYHGFYLNFS